jgi:hypothetical protein
MSGDCPLDLVEGTWRCDASLLFLSGDIQILGRGNSVFGPETRRWVAVCRLPSVFGWVNLRRGHDVRCSLGDLLAGCPVTVLLAVKPCSVVLPPDARGGLPARDSPDLSCSKCDLNEAAARRTRSRVAERSVLALM